MFLFYGLNYAGFEIKGICQFAQPCLFAIPKSNLEFYNTFTLNLFSDRREIVFLIICIIFFVS